MTDNITTQVESSSNASLANEDTSEIEKKNTSTTTDQLQNQNENLTVSRIVPTDIKQITLKNLDTGEEFIIGENDPDFDFDTFELCAGPHHENAKNSLLEDEVFDRPQNQQQSNKSWWKSILKFMYSMTSSNGQSHKNNSAANLSVSNHNENSTIAKTPFTKLSSFKFRKELGRGAFGRVLLAEAKNDGKLYALKIISKKNMRSSDKRQAKTERDILLAMGHISPHPFTTGLRFAFQSENNLYLGMDFLPGGNLKELIKRFGCLPEDWACLYAAELTLAIAHLHSLNVLYRDIKPHNVMIDGKGHLILIDFGLSKQDISHPRGALSLVGTPDYSAPEVLKTGVYQIEHSNKLKKKEKELKKQSKTIQRPIEKVPESNSVQVPAHIGYGKSADWWSLGIMIYEMIGGLPTFRGADLRQTYQKVLYAEVEFKPEEKFSEEAKDLLLGLLNKDPLQRLGSEENPPKDIMGHAFFNRISWSDVFERQIDGPWIPEPVTFTKKNQEVAEAIESEEYKQQEKSPLSKRNSKPASNKFKGSKSPPASPVDHKFINYSNNLTLALREDEVASPNKSKAVATPSPQIPDQTNIESNNRNEVMLKESIIAFSKSPQVNRIPDWSFFDEGILTTANRMDHLS